MLCFFVHSPATGAVVQLSVSLSYSEAHNPQMEGWVTVRRDQRGGYNSNIGLSGQIRIEPRGIRKRYGT